MDLLRSAGIRSHIDTLDTVWRAELARLLPELRDASQASQPSPSGDPAQRHRLFDAVSRAIVAGDRPRLLIIDDLQWCDAETIELIGFVIRCGPTAPVLIVGTARWEEIPPQHPLVGLVDALGHDQAVTCVPLDRLDQASTATLAARLCAEDRIDAQLAARLWRETEGNPLFVIEAVRAGFCADASQAVLTPTMRAVLHARLGQLSDGARRLAEVAAVIGRPFSVGLLVSATGIDEHQLIDQVDELWRRRIIRDQGLAYDFSHDKLRAVALEMLSPARRRHLHRAVAAAIAVGALHLYYSDMFAPRESPRLQALASHLRLSGARFYGTYWCGTCQEQKQLFGSSAKRLPFIECTPNGRNGLVAPACQRAQVNSYPTWIIRGERYHKVLSIDELARLSRFRWREPKNP